METHVFVQLCSIGSCGWTVNDTFESMRIFRMNEWHFRASVRFKSWNVFFSRTVAEINALATDIRTPNVSYFLGMCAPQKTPISKSHSTWYTAKIITSQSQSFQSAWWASQCRCLEVKSLALCHRIVSLPIVHCCFLPYCSDGCHCNCLQFDDAFFGMNADDDLFQLDNITRHLTDARWKTLAVTTCRGDSQQPLFDEAEVVAHCGECRSMLSIDFTELNQFSLKCKNVRK